MSLRELINEAVIGLHDEGLRTASTRLLEVLGYRSGKEIGLPEEPEAFWAGLEGLRKDIDKRKADVGHWKSAHFLFQLTNDEIPGLAHGQQALIAAEKNYQRGMIESFVFLAIELHDGNWTRTQLAQITRELNRAFPMPAILLFRHGKKASIAVIQRRLHKRDESKDVLEKVAIIKDIDLENPHRGHLEVLHDLAYPNLGKKQSPRNFAELYAEWNRILSVKELNRAFYKELANWYFWAITKVEFPKGGGVDRNSIGVIRMITRVIFIWFLKERDLVPEHLFSKAALERHLRFQGPDDSIYYRAILQNLFFATLNTEQDQRAWAKDSSGGYSEDFANPHAYRYKELFNDPGSALELFAGIPFLNGGLFECLDRVITVEEIDNNEDLGPLCTQEGRNRFQRVDGFSRRPESAARVPDEIFFREEALSEPQLNEVYDTSGRDYRVRGLFAILNSYKFTVEENTPVEEEVALDPELLGKVFENLLASYNPETETTARKQTGSFYTPREIVDYMVEESLHWYLAAALRDAGLGDKSETLRSIIGYSDHAIEITEAEKLIVIKAIDTIKVLDPACGSGAFPMGVLQRLVHILFRVDPLNINWYRRQLDRVETLEVEAKTIEESELRDRTLAGIASRKEAIKDAFERNDLDYGRKLFLIENCIYGVDIQPIAVQIAKLRVFISLMVSERIDESQPNRGIRSLPNLETNFVAANTLIKIEQPANKDLFAADPEIDAIEERLKLVRKELFSARRLRDKKRLRVEDEKLRRELAAAMVRFGYAPMASSLIAKWDPYQQNMAAEIFEPEWMFMINDGFDIVIGNPPYMRLQGLQQTQPEFVPYYRDHYESASGNFDIYALFVERCLDFLDPRGQLVFILPHKFFQASFAISLRKMLNRGKHLRQVVRFGAEQVFEEATTYTCLLFLSRSPQSEFEFFEVTNPSREVLAALHSGHPEPQYRSKVISAPTNENWDFGVGGASATLARLMQHPLNLGAITRKIFVGLQTSADKLYVLRPVGEEGGFILAESKHTGKVHRIERGLVKPFLMGKDVHRYDPPKADHVVIFPYSIESGKPEKISEADLMRRFPVAWNEYLEPNRDAFAAREKGKLMGQNVFSYIYPKNLAEFAHLKIMTPEIAARCEFTLDATGSLYHTTKVYSLALTASWHGREAYLLGLLNSKVLWFFIKSTGYVLRGGYYTFKTDYLKPFPIPEATSAKERLIADLVHCVLELRRVQKDHSTLTTGLSQSDPELRVASAHFPVAVAFFERLIDALAYELYFPEEFVEPSSRVSTALLGLEIPTPDESSFTLKAMALFRQLNDPGHEVRSLLHFLDTIETIRVVEEASR